MSVQSIRDALVSQGSTVVNAFLSPQGVLKPQLDAIRASTATSMTDAQLTLCLHSVAKTLTPLAQLHSHPFKFFSELSTKSATEINEFLDALRYALNTPSAYEKTMAHQFSDDELAFIEASTNGVSNRAMLRDLLITKKILVEQGAGLNFTPITDETKAAFVTKAARVLRESSVTTAIQQFYFDRAEGQITTDATARLDTADYKEVNFGQLKEFIKSDSVCASIKKAYIAELSNPLRTQDSLKALEDRFFERIEGEEQFNIEVSRAPIYSRKELLLVLLGSEDMTLVESGKHLGNQFIGLVSRRGADKVVKPTAPSTTALQTWTQQLISLELSLVKKYPKSAPTVPALSDRLIALDTAQNTTTVDYSLKMNAVPTILAILQKNSRHLQSEEFKRNAHGEQEAFVDALSGDLFFSQDAKGALRLVFSREELLDIVQNPTLFIRSANEVGITVDYRSSTNESVNEKTWEQLKLTFEKNLTARAVKDISDKAAYAVATLQKAYSEMLLYQNAITPGPQVAHYTSAIAARAAIFAQAQTDLIAILGHTNAMHAIAVAKGAADVAVTTALTAPVELRLPIVQLLAGFRLEGDLPQTDVAIVNPLIAGKKPASVLLRTALEPTISEDARAGALAALIQAGTLNPTAAQITGQMMTPIANVFTPAGLPIPAPAAVNAAVTAAKTTIDALPQVTAPAAPGGAPVLGTLMDSIDEQNIVIEALEASLTPVISPATTSKTKAIARDIVVGTAYTGAALYYYGVELGAVTTALSLVGTGVSLTASAVATVAVPVLIAALPVGYVVGRLTGRF